MTGTRSAFSGVVALDGPSGTGKSTVARRLAQRLEVRYLDTGAMYRAATVAVLGAGIELGDTPAVIDAVHRSAIDVSTDPSRAATWLDGRRVDSEIRSAEITASVSAVSAVEQVREVLVAAQRALIGTGGIVVEGRDIGTVVWPSARPKVYLNAQVETRAARRAGELSNDRLSDVTAAIERRDAYDSSRATSPLTRARDAVEIDTTYLSIDEVVQRLVDMTMAVMADQ